MTQPAPSQATIAFAKVAENHLQTLQFPFTHAPGKSPMHTFQNSREFLDYLKKNGQFTRCDDQFVGYVTVRDRKVISGPARTGTGKQRRLDFEERVATTVWNREQYTGVSGARPEIIIQILESPHEDEYRRPVPAPAAGTTGSALSRLYPLAYPMHRHLLNDGMYALVLVNAVQFQCSLGENTALHRSDIFTACWKKSGYKDDFIRRISGLFRPGDIVINSCTNGPAGLRYLVQEGLEKTPVPEADILKLHHPSCWQSTLNRYRSAAAKSHHAALNFEWDQAETFVSLHGCTKAIC